MAPNGTADRKGILFDSTLCIGCGACYEACKEENSLPKTSEDFLTDRLSADTYTVLREKDEQFVRYMCMHCQEPTCVSVCPVGAFEKTASGPVVYHGDRCIGCRYCMQACPFHVPRYEWESTSPLVRKCDLCSTRLAEGRETACAEICPTGATLFGERDALIQEARNRLRDTPENYVQRIYGLEEVGGTSVLILTSTPLEEFGYPSNLGSEALPWLTWDVLEEIPRFSVLSTILLGGIWWITNRREEVQRLEGQAEERDETVE